MKIKIFTLFLLVIFLNTGCNHWLEIDSKVVLSEKDIAKYPELVESQFLSNYAELRKSIQSIGDGAMSYYQHHLDAFTDDGASNIPWGTGIMQNNSPGLVFGGIFSRSNGETFSAIWNYKKINTINKFIEIYKNTTEEKIRYMLGEAYFIRAYLYFEMVKRYGGVPLYDMPLDNVTVINNRVSEEESWKFIKKDLDEAISLLPDTQPNTSEDKDRANKFTALSLKSRAMLYAGTIAKYGKVINNGFQGIQESSAKMFLLDAADAAIQVINNGKYKLTSNFGDLFNGNDENNEEIIFRFRNSKQSGVYVYNDYWEQPYRIKKEGYTAFMNPPLDVVEQFETLNGVIKPLDYMSHKTNLRDFFTDRDKRLEATIIFPGGDFLGERFSIYKKTILKKANGKIEEYSYNTQEDWNGAEKVPGYDQYMKSGFDGIFPNTSGAGTTNWGFFLKKTLYGVKKLENYLNQENEQDAVVIRYGEVILNFAEAAVELDLMGESKYLAAAQTEFNSLRSIHGGLPKKEITLENIRHERRIDLLYEGFRYWDQKRWRIGTQMHNTTMKALHPVLNIDETTDPVEFYYTLEKADAPNYLATRIKWFEERDYYSPLPVDGNPGIVQNIGWE